MGCESIATSMNALAGLGAYASIYVAALPGALRPVDLGLAFVPAGAVLATLVSGSAATEAGPAVQSAGNSVRSSWGNRRSAFP